MSYLKLADYLVNVAETKDREMVSAAMSAIREDLVACDQDLIMGVIYAIHHVKTFGEEEALEPLLLGLGVCELYPAARAIVPLAEEGQGPALWWRISELLDVAEKPMNSARVLGRAIVSVRTVDEQARIITMAHSLIKRKIKRDVRVA